MTITHKEKPAAAQATMASFIKNGAFDSKVQDPKTLRKDKKVVSVKDLRPGMKDWMIKVVAIFKAPMKSWKNVKGNGVLLSIDFIDATQKKPESMDAIQATFFQELAHKYEGLIEVEKVYYISRGTIKPTKFTSNRVKHPCVIHLDEHCKVENSEGVRLIEKHQYIKCT